MNLTTRPLTLAASAALAALSLTACTQSTSTVAEGCTPEWNFSTINEGKFTVAAVGALPYVDIKDNGASAAGIDGAFYTEFAKRACLTLEITQLGGPAAVAAVTEGRSDAGAGGWVATEERGKSIGQTDPVWRNLNGIASTDGLDSIEALTGKTVGTVAGSIYVEPLGTAVGKDAVKQYQSIDAAFQDLKAGRIDAVMGTAVELAYQAKVRGEDSLQVKTLEPDTANAALTEGGNINFPHTKTNTELTAALNAFIKDIQANGTVAKVLSEYGATDPRYTQISQ
jgi:polar amino acid transport system substrate-binding protein